MMEVIKKEVVKLLDVLMIYLISDSKWVSLVQLVLKRDGVTVMENKEGELVLTWVQSGWHLRIEYEKLSVDARKDNFPLSSIDQKLERLSGKSHYKFLDGFSGFHQILITPEH